MGNETQPVIAITEGIGTAMHVASSNIIDSEAATATLLQPASLDIWDSKYRLKDKAGNPIDASIDEVVYLYVGYCSSDGDSENFFYSNEAAQVCAPPA